MSTVTEAGGKSLQIKRVIKAPIAKVYEAWTDPVILAKWFSPNERWNKPTIAFDAKVGGAYRIQMNHSDGDVFEMGGEIRDLEPGRKITMTWQGLKPEVEIPSLLTIELRPCEGGTELTLTHAELATDELLEGVESGWGGCLDMLEKWAAGDPFWP